MSAIAGIHSRLGEPIDGEMLAQISSSMAQIGPDGENFAFAARVGMCYRPFHTDAESRFARQPVVHSDDSMLCWNGRLDNREELQQRLKQDLPAHPRSVDCVLAAYRRWGLRAFGLLIGDFALALWDAPRRRLLLAVDTLGRNPLYYRIDSRFVHWASQARPLAEAQGASLGLNEDYIANFLVDVPPVGLSPFLGVQSVREGHAVIVSGDRVEERRYWSFDPGRELRYQSDREYEEHFEELFLQAIACRMKTDGPVFCELSGGLDSSSIVCTGDRLCQEGNPEARDLQTVSYVYDDAPGSDESAYIRLVENQRGRKGHHIRHQEFPMFSRSTELGRFDHPSNRLCFLALHDRLADLMQEAGSRVLLRGLGGDQLFWSEPSTILIHLADLFVRRRPLQLIRSCRTYSQALGMNFLRAMREGLQPLLPRPFQANDEILGPELGKWLTTGFVRRTKIRDKRRHLAEDLEFRLPSRSTQYSSVREAMRIQALEMCFSRGNVEARDPFLDRRLVEFSLALPLEQKIRVQQTRSVQRRALKGVLPEQIRRRTSKSGPSEAFSRSLSRCSTVLSKALEDPLSCQYGFIEAEAFSTAIQRARHGSIYNEVLLCRTLALELWLRSLATPWLPRSMDSKLPNRRAAHSSVP